jgi:hypothetical protein
MTLPIQENVIPSNAKDLGTASRSFALPRMTTLLNHVARKECSVFREIDAIVE